MEVRLNIENLYKASNIFIVALFKLAESTPFIDLVLGLSFASQKILVAMESLEMITSEQRKEIGESLLKAAQQDVNSDTRLLGFLKDLKEDEDE
jgi:hypothetical protein